MTDKFELELNSLLHSVDNVKSNKLSEIAKSTNLNYENDLIGIDLSGQYLCSDNLSGMNLSYSNLNEANLSNTNLSNTNLSHASLIGANLTNTNFTNANLYKSIFGNNLGVPNSEFIIQMKSKGAIFIDTHLDDIQKPENTSSFSGKIIQPIQLLEDLQNLRNRLIRLKDRHEIIKTSLRIARRKLGAQVASIFLFSKDGKLHRVAIEGVDDNGIIIDDDWFQEECYEPSQRNFFIGRAAFPQEEGYGKPQMSNNLYGEAWSKEARDKYLSRLSALNCGIAVPLDGQSKTYGVLTVINKINIETDTVYPSCGFSEDEVHWLAAIGISVSTAISFLRRDHQHQLEADLGTLLVEADYDKTSAKASYDLLLKRLVSDNTAFKACTLRLRTGPHTLKVASHSGTDEVKWKKRNFDDVNINDDGYPAWATRNSEPAIEFRIEDIIDQFYSNADWVSDNKFKSYGCFPLISKGEVLGTMSFYTGYPYDFHVSCIRFLKRITTLLAAYIRRVNESGQMSRKMELLLNKAQNNDIENIPMFYDVLVDLDPKKIEKARKKLEYLMRR